MIIRLPGAKKGQSIAEPVELRDVCPTVLDATGAAPSRPIDGRSMLTDGKWKYTYNGFSGEEPLFNLVRDRGELENRSEDGAQLRLWRGRMIGHLEARGDAWVKGGSLATRQKMVQHSPLNPLYPRGR